MDASESLLAELIEDYHRRQARGERPRPDEYRDRAGGDFDRFLELLRQESLLDAALEGGSGERFPRTFGDYTLLEALGRGGIGNVYRALQRSLARPVALKVLQGGWADDEELIERFQRGARSAAQVEHLHAVRIHDFGVQEGRPYLAMSLLPGPTLQEIYRDLREAGGPPFGPAHHRVLDEAGVPGEGKDGAAFVRRLAALLAGPAEALELYHIRGIVHRDLKPGNLMMDGAGRLVLTDFDLAKRLDTQFRTATGRTLGTPAYMSPEQWDPSAPEVDRRADIYALGAVLYEGLTQRAPFVEPEDVGRLMRRVLTEAPPDPRALHAGLSDDARRVVLKAIEKRREDRYPSAGLMAEDLRAVAAGAAVKARPVPASVRAARWVAARRGRIAAALLLACGAALLLLQRKATIHVLSMPHAEASLDGTPIGRTPLRDRAIAAGSHELTLRRKGFRDRVERFEVGPGATRLLESRLEALDEADPAVLEAFFEYVGIRPPKPLPYSLDAGPRQPAVAALPRGKVTRADLDRFVVSGTEAAPGGALRLVDARGEEIWSGAAAGRETAIPPGLREAIPPGLYRWSYRGAEAEFELVAGAPPALPPGLDLPPERLRPLRIGLLGQRGFHAAAIAEALSGDRDGAAGAFFRESLAALGLAPSDLAPR